jgi:hypothetical protein
MDPPAHGFAIRVKFQNQLIESNRFAYPRIDREIIDAGDFDVGSLALAMLRGRQTADCIVDSGGAEAGVDDDRPLELGSHRLQNLDTQLHQSERLLLRGVVIEAQTQCGLALCHLCQCEVRAEFHLAAKIQHILIVACNLNFLVAGQTLFPVPIQNDSLHPRAGVTAETSASGHQGQHRQDREFPHAACSHHSPSEHPAPQPAVWQD